MFRLTHKQKKELIEEAVLELKWQLLDNKIEKIMKEQKALLAKMEGETA